MSSFTGKSIIVTGGGSGIGRAAAILLAQAGAFVTVADRNSATAEETVTLIEQEGGGAQPVRADVADESDVEAMVQRAVAAYCRLDGAVNAAGAPGCGLSLTDMSLEQWNSVIGINLSGMFLCVKHQLRAMLKSGGGSIVNISSATAVKGFPNAGEYSASKAGILSLTRTAAYEAGRQGIRVNALLPGVIDTPMFQNQIVAQPELEAMVANQHLLGRYGQPVELGYMIKFLLSDEASFVTGAAIAVDGGQSAN
jgi:2,5-dichloro-2,5-cyclohexadiene-1,4-diol dehydrogenase 1